MKKILFVLALACSGCVTTAEMANWIRAPKILEVLEVRHAQLCGTINSAASIILFHDLAAVQAWEQEHPVRLTPGEGGLPAGPYALVELGRRSSGGYGIAVSRKAALQGDVLTLKGTLISPSPGRPVAEMLTSPCVLVSLPRRDYSVVQFEDQSGEVRASTEDNKP